MKKLLEAKPSAQEISQEWRARIGVCGNVIFGKSKVESLLNRWHPLSNLYVAPPNIRELSLAIDIKEIEEKLYLSYVRRVRLSLFLLIVTISLVAYIGWLHEDSDKVHLAVALGSLFLFMNVDYYITSRASNVLFERSRFYLRVRENGRVDLALWSGLMAAAGIAQLLCQSSIGNFEKALTRYGIFYEALSRGEWWRLFTGTFFHVDAVHWLANLTSLLLIVGLGGIISRRLTFSTFLISSILGAYAGWIFSRYTHQDAYAGVSGGIFGIFGMCAAFSSIRHKDFPHKVGLTITIFSIVNIFISAVLVSNSSIEGHITGFFVGCLIGAIHSRTSKIKTPPARSSRAPC